MASRAEQILDAGLQRNLQVHAGQWRPQHVVDSYLSQRDPQVSLNTSVQPPEVIIEDQVQRYTVTIRAGEAIQGSLGSDIYQTPSGGQDVNARTMYVLGQLRRGNSTMVGNISVSLYTRTMSEVVNAGLRGVNLIPQQVYADLAQRRSQASLEEQAVIDLIGQRQTP